MWAVQVVRTEVNHYGRKVTRENNSHVVKTLPRLKVPIGVSLEGNPYEGVRCLWWYNGSNAG